MRVCIALCAALAATSAPSASNAEPLRRIAAAEPPAAVTPPEAVDEPQRTSGSADPRGLQGIAIGIEAGEPLSATLAWFRGRLVLAAGIGTGTVAGLGLSLHGDVQLQIAELAPRTPLRVGVGLRYFHHGYAPASFDEIPDSHVGVRASLAIARQFDRAEIYVEAAPGIDVKRSASCTLASGPDSICPHAMSSPFFLQLVLGARWFLSN